MKEIYPTPDSQKALTVFQLYEGSGEWFDLSKKPIERFSFSFGRVKAEPKAILLQKPAPTAALAKRYVRKTVLISLPFQQ